MKGMFGLGILVGGFMLAIWLRQRGRLGTCWLVLIGTVIVVWLLRIDGHADRDAGPAFVRRRRSCGAGSWEQGEGDEAC